MTVLLAIGAFAVLLVIATMRLGRVADIDVSDITAGPVVLVAAVAGLSAFGVGGSTVLRHTDASAVSAAMTGIVLGAVAAACGVRAVRSRL